jgi:hypothetical protein
MSPIHSRLKWIFYLGLALVDTYTIAATAIVALLACSLLLLSEYIFAIPARIIASLSGWDSFVSSFPLNKKRGGTIFRFCTIGINSMQYRSCINLILNEDTVTFSPMFPFRSYHPQFTISINHLRRESKTISRFGLTKYAIQNFDGVIWLPFRVASNLPKPATTAHSYR